LRLLKVLGLADADSVKHAPPFDYAASEPQRWIGGCRRLCDFGRQRGDLDHRCAITWKTAWHGPSGGKMTSVIYGGMP